MRIISRTRLREFWEAPGFGDSEGLGEHGTHMSATGAWRGIRGRA